ncbi:hypothetical protein C3K47_13100 [Solitalea longa]|uniref:Cyclic nucleotide-binding domain-containing protein n=1 Tax=Solitalea longa TaxID=2079460 RepID=A0A2S5A1H6_9SPHI|nr:Crp/Fnr family transcriptional regulator [Solitalea longa]POY36127.1 hypothetical protein C3K47_13100 [Solitalea longa]
MVSFGFDSYLSLFQPLSKEAQDAISNVSKFKSLPAKSTLLSEGSVEKDIFHLNKGLVRGYFHMADREVTLWINYEPSPFGNSESFFQQIPSEINIETVEPSEITYISYEAWFKLLNEYPEIERISRLISQANVQRLYRRIKILHYSTPEEKYRYLIEHEPEMIQRTPLKFIASYLNITPETLSRIRAKI